MAEPNYTTLLDIEEQVRRELGRAIRKHSPMHSPHEAYAVILEEVEKYWTEVKKQIPDRGAMRYELTQVAAMAIRAIHDLNLLEAE